jgi:hypothetical protein
MTDNLEDEYESLATLLRKHDPKGAAALLEALERLYWDEGERLDALRDAFRVRGVKVP